jgi:tRNA-dihydrouridine synthase
VDEIRNRIVDTKVASAMVGRAATDHPCSFAEVDPSLWGETNHMQTRRKARLNYLEYCGLEEERLKRPTTNDLASHRKRLVAPAFHLFMGEPGNEAFQRRLRKLVSRADRHSATSMVVAATAEIPAPSLDKPIHDHLPWSDVAKYDFTKKSGALQRTIY